MSKQWYVVDYADDLVVNAGTYSTMETLIKKLHGGLALVQYADLTPQMKQGETIHETKEKQMKNLQPFIDNIIMRATTLMNEYSDMMEAYEMSDYAEKCEMLDELWVAIDEYLKEVKLDDDNEMEDLGLS